MAQRTQTMLVYSIRVSQGCVATCLRGGRIFNDSFITDFLQSVPVKEFWKSVEKLQSYWSSLVYYFFGDTEYTADNCRVNCVLIQCDN